MNMELSPQPNKQEESIEEKSFTDPEVSAVLRSAKLNLAEKQNILDDVIEKTELRINSINNDRQAIRDYLEKLDSEGAIDDRKKEQYDKALQSLDSREQKQIKKLEEAQKGLSQITQSDGRKDLAA